MTSTDVPDNMVVVPGGRFLMGAENGYLEESPVHDVEVGRFAIDRYPVTNREYFRFCQETDHPPPKNPAWPDMPDYLERYPDYPVVNVHYKDAVAYASWIGKRLPTEAEWEYAARAGRSGDSFPWGDQQPGNSRAQFATRDTEFPWREYRNSTGFTRTTPVGSFPPNDFGVYDMSGNVWEWCGNWFYNYPWQDLDTNLVEEGWGLTRVVRGGAFHSPVEDLRVSRRLRVHGGVGGNGTGFRCVKDLESSPLATAPSLPDPPDFDIGSLDDLVFSRPKHLPNEAELCLGCDPDLSSDQAARISALGFTSVEQYVHWATVEPDREGEFNFSHWDAQVEVLRTHRLKWVPFLIAGPAYSLPRWFLQSSAHHGAVCLEHRLESKIQSIFDREFDRHIARFLRAFANRYRDSGVIESLLLGITGDFGEAIYPVTGTAWTQVDPGPYHTHPGYWCGDPLAQDDFRMAMGKKYDGNLNALNTAWGTRYDKLAEIAMPRIEIPDGIEAFRADEPTAPGSFVARSPTDRRCWLDFMDWYRESMNRLAAIWLHEARNVFPDHPIYLCTGGDAPPHQGAHFGDQCRVAASVGGGVRITNEASNYPRNFAFTRWVTSAGRFYGAYTGIEPAGGVNDLGVTCRVFNAAVSGSRNLHFYSANILHHAETLDAWNRCFSTIGAESPRITVAFLYPDASVMLGLASTSSIARQIAKVRDLMDLDYLDDAMLAAGALSSYDVLILARCPVIEAKTLARIDAWMGSGGLLVMLGNNRIETVESEPWSPEFEDQSLTVSEFSVDPQQCDTVAEMMSAWLSDRSHPLIDGILDGLYFSSVTDRLLVLNHTRETIDREVSLGGGGHISATFAANSITTIPLTT